MINVDRKEAPPNAVARTFDITTLGCKVNQADSEAIASELMQRGMRAATTGSPADVVIVNTCTVTHLGDRSSRQAISQARRDAPDAFIVATGCYAQVDPAAVARLAGVDLVVPNTEKSAMSGAIELKLTDLHRSYPRLLPLAALFPTSENQDRALADFLGRTRAQIKVQDGCDNRCTYCIVPTARGASQSRSIADVVAFARRKASAGIQEIVLTGVHLGDYHPDPGTDLGDLLATLLRETDIPRIRVSSLEPEDFRLEWLDLWQDSRLCRHLHLPLQSGSDAVLRKMGRRYDTARYRTLVYTARGKIADLALTTDIIAGFPGETEEDAGRSFDFAMEMEFSKMHVFRFSPRAGTAAARMRRQVPDDVKRDRAAALLGLGDTMARTFRRRAVGKRVQVLWEGRRMWGWEGLTDNYLRVELHAANIPPGRDLHHQRTLAEILGLTPEGLEGRLAEDAGSTDH